MFTLVILPFLQRYWLIILLAVIVSTSLLYVKHLQSQRDILQAWKNAHIAAEQALTDTRRLENAQKKADADAKLLKVDTDRRLALEKLGLSNVNRDELTKKVSALNAKLNETNTVIDRNRANTTDSLRLASERDSLRMSESTQTAAGLSTSDSNYAAFRDACRLTTLDLIECQGIVEADTLACGREQ